MARHSIEAEAVALDPRRMEVAISESAFKYPHQKAEYLQKAGLPPDLARKVAYGELTTYEAVRMYHERQRKLMEHAPRGFETRVREPSTEGMSDYAKWYAEARMPGFQRSYLEGKKAQLEKAEAKYRAHPQDPEARAKYEQAYQQYEQAYKVYQRDIALAKKLEKERAIHTLQKQGLTKREAESAFANIRYIYTTSKTEEEAKSRAEEFIKQYEPVISYRAWEREQAGLPTAPWEEHYRKTGDIIGTGVIKGFYDIGKFFAHDVPSTLGLGGVKPKQYRESRMQLTWGGQLLFATGQALPQLPVYYAGGAAVGAATKGGAALIARGAAGTYSRMAAALGPRVSAEYSKIAFSASKAGARAAKAFSTRAGQFFLWSPVVGMEAGKVGVMIKEGRPWEEIFLEVGSDVARMGAFAKGMSRGFAVGRSSPIRVSKSGKEFVSGRLWWKRTYPMEKGLVHPEQVRVISKKDLLVGIRRANAGLKRWYKTGKDVQRYMLTGKTVKYYRKPAKFELLPGQKLPEGYVLVRPPKLAVEVETPPTVFRQHHIFGRAIRTARVDMVRGLELTREFMKHGAKRVWVPSSRYIAIPARAVERPPWVRMSFDWSYGGKGLVQTKALRFRTMLFGEKTVTAAETTRIGSVYPSSFFEEITVKGKGAELFKRVKFFGPRGMELGKEFKPPEWGLEYELGSRYYVSGGQAMKIKPFGKMEVKALPSVKATPPVTAFQVARTGAAVEAGGIEYGVPGAVTSMGIQRYAGDVGVELAESAGAFGRQVGKLRERVLGGLKPVALTLPLEKMKGKVDVSMRYKTLSKQVGKQMEKLGKRTITVPAVELKTGTTPKVTQETKTLQLLKLQMIKVPSIPSISPPYEPPPKYTPPLMLSPHIQLPKLARLKRPSQAKVRYRERLWPVGDIGKLFGQLRRRTEKRKAKVKKRRGGRRAR